MKVSDRDFYVLTSRAAPAEGTATSEEDDDPPAECIDVVTDTEEEIIERAAGLLEDGAPIEGMEIVVVKLDEHEDKWGLHRVPWRDVVEQVMA